MRLRTWKITYGMKDGTGPHIKTIGAQDVDAALMMLKDHSNIIAIEHLPDHLQAIADVANCRVDKPMTKLSFKAWCDYTNQGSIVKWVEDLHGIER